MQVGHIVDVTVGHIEHFKFQEEFQVDFHLRKAGFLQKLDAYVKSSSPEKESVPILKTEAEKLSKLQEEPKNHTK